MTEHEAFEIRFHAAVRDYARRVSSDLDPVELAHEIAVARPRRSGLLAPRLPGFAIPRLAWVLLLVAGLLAATVGGLLVAGSQPKAELPAMVPAVLPAIECPPGSNPDTPGPVGQVRPPQTFAAPAMAFDRRAGRIVMLVEADPSGLPQIWTFDVCTNTWTRMADGPTDAGRNQLVYDADSDRSITIDTVGRVWAYDLASDTWTAKGFAPSGAGGTSSQGRPRLVYGPVSGNVLVAYGIDRLEWAGASPAPGRPGPDLFAYDVERDVWTAVSTGDFSSSVLIAYDTAADRLVVYDFGVAGVTTRLLDLRTGAWSDVAAVTPSIRLNWFTTGNEIAYDEAARRTVIFNVGRMDAYDAGADWWTVAYDEAPGGDFRDCLTSRCRSYATTIYDPVNQRLVVYGGIYADSATAAGTSVQDDSVLAYDLATGTWSVLLEATGVQPAG